MFSCIFADTWPRMQSEQNKWRHTVGFENISDWGFESMQMSQKLSDDWGGRSGCFVFIVFGGVEVEGNDDDDDDDDGSCLDEVSVRDAEDIRASCN